MEHAIWNLELILRISFMWIWYSDLLFVFCGISWPIFSLILLFWDQIAACLEVEQCKFPRAVAICEPVSHAIHLCNVPLLVCTAVRLAWLALWGFNNTRLAEFLPSQVSPSPLFLAVFLWKQRKCSPRFGKVSTFGQTSRLNDQIYEVE